MSMIKTKEQQYAIDRDLALYHGIDRDTPGGHAGRWLRQSQQPLQLTTLKHYTPDAASEKSASGGSWWFWILVLIVIL